MPSSRRSTVASLPMRSAIQEQPATPQPRIKPSFFIDPICGVRRDQPNFSAPTLRHSTMWREEKGRFMPSSF